MEDSIPMSSHMYPAGRNPADLQIVNPSIQPFIEFVVAGPTASASPTVDDSVAVPVPNTFGHNASPGSGGNGGVPGPDDPPFALPPEIAHASVSREESFGRLITNNPPKKTPTSNNTRIPACIFSLPTIVPSPYTYRVPHLCTRLIQHKSPIVSRIYTLLQVNEGKRNNSHD